MVAGDVGHKLMGAFEESEKSGERVKINIASVALVLLFPIVRAYRGVNAPQERPETN